MGLELLSLSRDNEKIIFGQTGILLFHGRKIRVRQVKGEKHYRTIRKLLS